MSHSLESSTEPRPSEPVTVPLRVFEDVYNDQYRTMVQVARLTTGSPAIAEELVQDAFADLYRRFERVRAPDAYLRRAVVSRCTSWVRRRTTERRYLERDRPELTTSAETADLDVFDAVQALPVRQRTAVVLRYFADWSEADIAAALACRPGTVKSLLSRARSHLCTELDHDR